MSDEFKVAQLRAILLPDGRVRLPGAMRLDQAAPVVGGWRGSLETVAAHIVSVLGRLPEPGERVSIDGLDVEIEVVEDGTSDRSSSDARRRTRRPAMTAFLIIAVLILLNGLFVAAEFAIVGAPRAAIDARARSGNRLARLVQTVLRDPQSQDRYIATAQLGITVASLGLGMYGEHVLADGIYAPARADIRARRGCSRTALPASSRSPSSPTSTSSIGEMVPKSLALQHAERMALWITPPMLWIKTLVFPLDRGAERHRQRGPESARRQPPGPERRAVLHAGGAAADRPGERGAGRDAGGVRPDAAGALRVRRPDRRAR